MQHGWSWGIRNESSCTGQKATIKVDSIPKRDSGIAEDTQTLEVSLGVVTMQRCGDKSHQMS